MFPPLAPEIPRNIYPYPDERQNMMQETLFCFTARVGFWLQPSGVVTALHQCPLVELRGYKKLK